MVFASSLLADAGNLATSGAAAISPDAPALGIGWQTLIVALAGIAGAAALLATRYAFKQLVPVKVRRR